MSEQMALWERERDKARLERANKRLFILCLILMLLLAASWAGFFIYEQQFETIKTVEQDVEQIADGDGYNQFVGGDYYGDAADQNGNG